MKLKHVHIVTKWLADGSRAEYHYHRKTGRRINADPNDQRAYLKAYEEASEWVVDAPDTFAGLVMLWKQALPFLGVSGRTQADYRHYIEVAANKFGSVERRDIEADAMRHAFVRWHRSYSDTPRKADHLIGTVSVFLTWCVEEGHLSKNHALNIKKLYRGGGRSDIIWTAADIEKFMAANPKHMQRAMMLAVNTGQRQGDLIDLTRNNLDLEAGMIRLRHNKTGARVSIPILPQLRPWLENLPASSMVLMPTSRKKPEQMAFTSSGFRASWAAAVERAGLEKSGLRFHDLRGTAYTMLRDAGCTREETRAIIGTDLENVYAKRTDALALSAFRKITGTKV